MSDTGQSDNVDRSNDSQKEVNDSSTIGYTATIEDKGSNEYDTDLSSDTYPQNSDDTELRTGTESDTEADTGIDAGKDTDTALERDTQTGEWLCGTNIYDKDCGLCWRTEDAPGTYQWAEGVKYCKDLVFDGHNDWRLPSLSDFDCLLGGCKQIISDSFELYCDTCANRPKCSEIFTESQMDNNTYWGGNTDKYYDFCIVFPDSLISPGGSKEFYRSVRCVRDI